MTGPQLSRPRVSLARVPDDDSYRNLLVLDDNATFADAVASRLNAEPGVRAVAASTIEEARQVMRARAFDGLLLDLDPDGHHALRFAAEAMAEQPNLRVIAITDCAGERETEIIEAVRIGVVGWVCKDEPVEHLLAVVRGTLIGETWIPPSLLTFVIASLKAASTRSAENDALLATLTRRELQVLGLMVGGSSIDAIAAQLFVSRNTVRTHIQNVISKLGVHSAVAAVAVARRASWQGGPANQPGLLS
jgi:DNA-binding NarL/FixJ family response regulator